MADTATKVERTYNVPLRVEWLKAPRYRRAKKALIGLRQFIAKHMKSDDVSIGQYANEAIWANGIQCPPHHLKVSVLKQADGKVYVELFGKPIVTEKKEDKKKSLAEKLGMKKKNGKDDVKDAEVVSEIKNEEKEAVEVKAEEKTETTEEEAKPKKAKKAKEEIVEAEVKE